MTLHRIVQKHRERLIKKEKEKLDSDVIKSEAKKKEEHKVAQDKKGKLKKKYRDMPRFKVIIEYEDEFKKNFEKKLKKMTYGLADKLTQQIITK